MTASGACRAIRSPIRSSASPLRAKARNTGSFSRRSSPATIVELYQKHVSPDVKKEDLFRNGRYDARNRWNNSTTAGAMHLIQPNNTLGAEIELAGAATIVRRRERRRDYRGAGVDRVRSVRRIPTSQRSAHRSGGERAGADEGRYHIEEPDRPLHRRPLGRQVGRRRTTPTLSAIGRLRVARRRRRCGRCTKCRRPRASRPATSRSTARRSSSALRSPTSSASSSRAPPTRLGQSTVAPFDACVARAADADPVDVAELGVEDVLKAQGFRSRDSGIFCPHGPVACELEEFGILRDVGFRRGQAEFGERTLAKLAAAGFRKPKNRVKSVAVVQRARTEAMNASSRRAYSDSQLLSARLQFASSSCSGVPGVPASGSSRWRSRTRYQMWLDRRSRFLRHIAEQRLAALREHRVLEVEHEHGRGQLARQHLALEEHLEEQHVFEGRLRHEENEMRVARKRELAVSDLHLKCFEHRRVDRRRNARPRDRRLELENADQGVGIEEERNWQRDLRCTIQCIPRDRRAHQVHSGRVHDLAQRRAEVGDDAALSNTVQASLGPAANARPDQQFQIFCLGTPCPDRLGE